MFAAPSYLPKGWRKLRTFIRVTREVKKNEKTTHEVAFYISSLPSNTSAKTFSEGIRGHWLIENSLHYTKDVTLGEDASRIRMGNGPTNMSVMRNIVLNIFRSHGYTNIAQAIRLVANNIPKLYHMILA